MRDAFDSLMNVDRFFISFNLLKICSQEATVIGNVRNTFRAILVLGYVVWIEYLWIWFKRSKGVAVAEMFENASAWNSKHSISGNIH